MLRGTSRLPAPPGAPCFLAGPSSTSSRNSMRVTSLGLLAVIAATAGCWRVTVTSNATPAPTVVEKPWQHSFIQGLVPPAEVSVKDPCPNGVAKVETVHSPANL